LNFNIEVARSRHWRGAGKANAVLPPRGFGKPLVSSLGTVSRAGRCRAVPSRQTAAVQAARARAAPSLPDRSSLPRPCPWTAGLRPCELLADRLAPCGVLSILKMWSRCERQSIVSPLMPTTNSRLTTSARRSRWTSNGRSAARRPLAACTWYRSTAA